MKRMQRGLHFSGLYVTHDQAEAMELGDRVAVLQSGRVAALGPPRDIYDNPPTEYVATVLGAANVWPVTKLESVDSALRIETSVGALLIATTENSVVSVMVRPERIRIAKAGVAGAIEGIVAAKSFAGSMQQFHVQCGETLVRIVSPQDESIDAIAEGDAVSLSINPSWIKPLRADGAGA